MQYIEPMEAAWLAGILEGEGCFDSTAPGNPSGPRIPRVRLMMTDEDIVARFAEMTERRLKPVTRRSKLTTPFGKPAKPAWECEVRGWNAIELMALVRPFMGTRRTARIDEVTELYYAQRPKLQQRQRSAALVGLV